MLTPAMVRKWGNSLDLIIPTDLVRSRGLRDGDIVDIEIRRRARSPEELCGTYKFRTGLARLLVEMEEGWEDR